MYAFKMVFCILKFVFVLGPKFCQKKHISTYINRFQLPDFNLMDNFSGMNQFYFVGIGV